MSYLSELRRLRYGRHKMYVVYDRCGKFLCTVSAYSLKEAKADLRSKGVAFGRVERA